ncbi:unnamed protein product [Chrysoparadoxa australica]
MQENSDNVECLKTCCGALAIMAKDEANKLLIARDGTRMVLSSMELHGGRADLQEAACDLVWSLAFNNALVKEMVGKQGGISLILKAMGMHASKAELAKSACGALSNMCQNAYNQNMIASHGGIRCILAALASHKNNPAILPFIFDALASLIVGNESNGNLISESSGVKSILDAVALHKSRREVVKSGCHVLAILSDSAGQGSQICQAGGAKVLLSVLARHVNFARFHRIAAIVLLRMLQESEVAQDITAQGGVQIMLAMLKEHVMEVETVAATVHILYLLTHDEIMKGGLEQEVEQQFLGKVPEVAVIAPGKVRAAAPVSGSGVVMGKTGGAGTSPESGDIFTPNVAVALVGVLLEHRNRRDIVRAAMRSLASIVKFRSVSTALLSFDGTLAAVLACMSLHSSSRGITDSAITTVHILLARAHAKGSGGGAAGLEASFGVEKTSSGGAGGAGGAGGDQGGESGAGWEMSMQGLHSMLKARKHAPEVAAVLFLAMEAVVLQWGKAIASVRSDSSTPKGVFQSVRLSFPASTASGEGSSPASSADVAHGKEGQTSQALRTAAIHGAIRSALSWLQGAMGLPHGLAAEDLASSAKSKETATCSPSGLLLPAMAEAVVRWARLLLRALVELGPGKGETMGVDDIRQVFEADVVGMLKLLVSKCGGKGRAQDALRELLYKLVPSAKDEEELNESAKGCKNEAPAATSAKSAPPHNPLRPSSNTGRQGKRSSTCSDATASAKSQSQNQPNKGQSQAQGQGGQYQSTPASGTGSASSKDDGLVLMAWPELEPLNKPCSPLRPTPTPPPNQPLWLVYESASAGGRGIQSRVHAPDPYWVARPTAGAESPYPHSLEFDSSFEGANLLRAVQRGEAEYDLFLRPDLHTHGHTQWFYFKVTNTHPPGSTGSSRVRFHIVSLTKPDSMFKEGLRLVMYSHKDAEQGGTTGWKRCGTDISYTQNGYPCFKADGQTGNFYTLSFEVEFANPGDTYRLAHCYPYTYSQHKRHLASLLADGARSKHLRWRLLCHTLGGLEADLLTITDHNAPEDEIAKRRRIVITARVHPGEVPASWMMRGMLDFLTSETPEALLLRSMFVFRVVPMLNPDGVSYGNNRCGLAGVDLNRQWKRPKRNLHPTIYYTKAMMRAEQQKAEIAMYIDLHGHSRKQNIFLYGCDEKKKGLSRPTAQVFPKLVSWNRVGRKYVSFKDCSFAVKKGRESTARVVVARELGIMNSYTVESTFCGMDFGPLAQHHLNTGHFQEAGQAILDSLLDYFMPNQAHREQATNQLVVLSNQRRLSAEDLVVDGNADIESDPDDDSVVGSEGDGEEEEDDDEEEEERPQAESGNSRGGVTTASPDVTPRSPHQSLQADSPAASECRKKPKPQGKRNSGGNGRGQGIGSRRMSGSCGSGEKRSFKRRSSSGDIKMALEAASRASEATTTLSTTAATTGSTSKGSLSMGHSQQALVPKGLGLKRGAGIKRAGNARWLSGGSAQGANGLMQTSALMLPAKLHSRVQHQHSHDGSGGLGSDDRLELPVLDIENVMDSQKRRQHNDTGEQLTIMGTHNWGLAGHNQGPHNSYPGIIRDGEGVIRLHGKGF